MPEILTQSVVLSQSEAKALRLQPLAGPYSSNEQWMLDNVLSDLTRGHRRFFLVTSAERATAVDVFIPRDSRRSVHTADSLE